MTRRLFFLCLCFVLLSLAVSRSSSAVAWAPLVTAAQESAPPASALPIAEVGLTCAGRTQTESLSGSDTIARFASETPGGCTLILQGNVPMRVNVEVPTTGGEVRCSVRGGRVSCG